MLELRKDYLLDRWVIISEKRRQRPKQFKKVEIKKDDSFCYFCPGNEHTTPPEIGRIEEKSKWKIRWFPNKFPAVDEEGNPKIISKGFFSHAAAYGRHDVIAETPDHNKQLWDLKAQEIKEVLKVYSLRIKELSQIPNIKYVIVLKNHGREGGTSLIHTHTQVIAYNKIPELVKDEAKAVKRFRKCPYCDIIKVESESKRRVFVNKSFVSFTPYASRFNYEVWLFPRRHVKNITELDDKELTDLALMLQKILVKLRLLNCGYNFFLHYAPKGSDLHFHIEVTPRIATWAGYELASNETINSVSPESAAAFYRK
jgi:UDPglucose--hexose-1-phosphate uridylyltransferase